VWLIQGEASCVPCLMEGCERKLDSRSRCLDEMPLGRVTAAIAQALAMASLRN
jgi:heptosyltransferase-3